MAAKKILGLGVVVVFLGGCQSWQYRDIEKLPPTAAIPEVSEPGKVDAWYFDGISGNNVQSLIDAEKFPDSPDEITELNQLRRAANRANNYGTLIRGYLEPPATGEYTFYPTLALPFTISGRYRSNRLNHGDSTRQLYPLQLANLRHSLP
jgi:hypothetical protein